MTAKKDAFMLVRCEQDKGQLPTATDQEWIRAGSERCQSCPDHPVQDQVHRSKLQLSD